MPRRDFLADLTAVADDTGFDDVKDVRQGGDDNLITMMVYSPECQSGIRLNCIITPDVGEYPKGHSYYLYVEDDAPKAFSERVEALCEKVCNPPPAGRKKIQALLKEISKEVCAGDVAMVDASEDEDEDEDEFDDMMYSDEEYVGGNGHANASSTARGNRTRPEVTRERIRCDLLLAKATGFKVGYYGGLVHGTKCYVCLSTRISKLGISEEAMQAWHVKPQDYLILAISYDTGYMSMDDINSDLNMARLNIKFRVGMSHTYKPTYKELVDMWDRLAPQKRHSVSESETTTETVEAVEDVEAKGWHNTFISQPLNQLLNERFLYILRSREQLGMSWAGAEEYVHESQGMQGHDIASHADGINDKYMTAEDTKATYPEIVTSDHIKESPHGQSHSFPLLAMQFVLRHFVRCTEFCLVCHCKLNDALALEAIKPYVCENPLCLYQYMSLGFGPSMEHEILTQPLVVDLLISFCWSAAVKNSLGSFPDGLSLSVPDPALVHHVDGLVRLHTAVILSENPEQQAESEYLLAKYDARKRILSFKNDAHGLRFGDWLQFRYQTSQSLTSLSSWEHRRVIDCFGSSVSLSEYCVDSNPPSTITASEEVSSQNVYVIKYGSTLDDLSGSDKSQTIMNQLDLLPSVEEMRSYIRSSSKNTLSNWTDRTTPAAVGILRWVIASNRACIMQVTANAQVAGISDAWAQFRFAMGAPDKEKRFIKAVNETQNRLNLRHPTLLAWHGSPIWNWHSIIRQGLKFDRISHGRAFGNGVYFSQNFSTSLGYSGDLQYANVQHISLKNWSRTALGVASAMALNEITNAPDEYVSRHPHFVVGQLDWIQTRYLFVKCVEKQPPLAVHPIQVPFVQDPQRIPNGDTGPISLPATAIRRPRALQSTHRNNPPENKSKNPFKHIAKKVKTNPVESITIADDDKDDLESVATLVEDLDIFDDLAIEEVEAVAKIASPKSLLASIKARLAAKQHSAIVVPETDFVPGSLDHKTLPLLKAPEGTGTTSAAAVQLMQSFMALQAVQKAKPIPLLGWFVDPDQLDNLFQWIVEFHTFEKKLPLAKDMKDKKVTSIVLEMRFQTDFPMSPPFVRVIRPRLLPFQQGGGGHVTAGGSLCMELLTNSGWSPVMGMENVLVAIRQELTDLEPNPARLDHRSGDYGIMEAVEGYIRACQVHGWQVPLDFRNSIMMMDANSRPPQD